MARIALAPLTKWITGAALQAGADLPAVVMQRLGLSRRRALTLLRQLEQLQWLQTSGPARHPVYGPGAFRQVVQHYALAGLQEDQVWRRDFAPCFDLPPEVAQMARHACTELLNNAVDHSGGQAVTVSLRQTPLQLQLLVSDDGCGLFARLAGHFDLPDPRLAMLELSKGRLSTAPQGHSGLGLPFTMRLADVMSVHANRAAFQRRAWEQQPWHDAPPVAREGTSIYLAITLDTPRTLDGVLRELSLNPAAFDTDRTQVPLWLLADPPRPGACGPAGAARSLVSRAEARRAVARLPLFKRAEIDFSGVGHVGHSFADEVFRVFAHRHPGVELSPVGMAPQVGAMVGSIQRAAATA
jgi:anti-sigma regulatory factor (Ser/Thr protein kinase)